MTLETLVYELTADTSKHKLKSTKKLKNLRFEKTLTLGNLYGWWFVGDCCLHFCHC